MKIEPIKESSANGLTVSVRKTAYCDVHTPADSDFTPVIGNISSEEDRSASAKKAKEKSKIKMRKARKILAEKRNALPVVSVPVIPQQRLSKITCLINLPKKQQFLTRLVSYWTLKRQSRNGVPLLRRLQSNHMTRNKHETKNDKQSNALKEQLKYWQRLRQDLEKARLLVELIRKREKIKREQLRVHQMAMELQLQPFAVLLRNTLDLLVDKDTSSFFTEPVSLEEVPDYRDYIDHPMDFETMRNKIDNHQYKTMDDFEADFDLIIKNCMKYNAKDTVFYRAAVKLRDQGGMVIRASRRTVERVGYDPSTGLHLETAPNTTDPVVLEDIDSFLEHKESIPLEEQLRILLDKMDAAHASRKPGKSKLAKRIRQEIVKVRRKLALQKGQRASDLDETVDTASETNYDSMADDSRIETPVPDTPKSPTHKSPSTDKEKTPNIDKEKAGIGRGANKDTPTRGRGRGRGRGRWGRASKSRLESESESPVATRKIEKRRSSDSSRTTESSTSSKNEDSNSGHPALSGVNRRTAVLFSKKIKSNKNDSSAPSSPGTPTRPATPPRKVGKGRGSRNRSQSQHEKVDSPQPPVLEPMMRTTRGPASPKSPKSPAMRKRSASALGSPEREGRPTPPKRTNSLTEPLAFSEPPDITKKDSFLRYRGPDNLRSSSESDSTSVISTSDDSLSDSSMGSSSSNSRSACLLCLVRAFFMPGVELNSHGMPKLSEEGTESDSSTLAPPTQAPQSNAQKPGNSLANHSTQSANDPFPACTVSPVIIHHSPSIELICEPDCIELFISDDPKINTKGPNFDENSKSNLLFHHITKNLNHEKMWKCKSKDGRNAQKLLKDDTPRKSMASANKSVQTASKKQKTTLGSVNVDQKVLDGNTSEVEENEQSFELPLKRKTRSSTFDQSNVKAMPRCHFDVVRDSLCKNSAHDDDDVKFIKHKDQGKEVQMAKSQELYKLLIKKNTSHFIKVHTRQFEEGRAHRSGSCDSEDMIPLEPLDLVWAKCRGYPWYPALIINPKMPKTGYFHNGVPIPVPPDDVLALQRKYDEPVYLILFFDTKRTWQWLPRNKLEPLGVDSGLDKAKLLENKKPNIRKAVQKAYEKAILHRCSVTGEPNPLSGDSEIDDQE
ncbi:hypothetical protein FSP39_020657 [Pinctada imbricata]|uniref:Uncharacterized protein n=1 Tax=Pinctada imbricata TaxID=66713 RepID=A0AA89C0P0_PINIB|nr:hypothetical protein FSP39_020657 [Pinctada imbricata]